jgi:ABC-2 type transport system permease protein
MDKRIGLMKKVLAITFKELASYFQSPMAYIVTIVAIVIFNVFFYLIINENREAYLTDVFKVMEFMFVFIIPILTMKIFAEEKQIGTMEFLLTTPTTVGQIVFGKFLGSLAFFSVIIALTKIYELILLFYGRPDLMAMCTGYFGVWLEGALFISIGIFISALTTSQMIAAISSYMIIFSLYFGFNFIQYAPKGLEPYIRGISVMSHTENLFGGLIYLSDIIYFISAIGFFLIVTCFTVDRKRWQ